MLDLEHALTQLLWRHRGDKSRKTLARMRQELKQMARDLHGAGYTGLTEPRHLKGRHIDYLVRLWAGKVVDTNTGEMRKAIAPGTRKTRASTLRFWARMIGKPALMPSKNETLGMPPRKASPDNVAWSLSDDRADRFQHPVMKIWVQGQEFIGMRKEEVMLVNPVKADRGDGYLYLEKTKGARPRRIPILTPQQRAWVDKAKAFASTTPQGSLIPFESLKAAMEVYKNEMARAGLKRGHGLRHAYAQRRYFALTGWRCPKEGGPPRRKLTWADKRLDKQVRLQISEELGHGRLEVVVTYLG